MVTALSTYNIDFRLQQHTTYEINGSQQIPLCLPTRFGSRGIATSWAIHCSYLYSHPKCQHRSCYNRHDCSSQERAQPSKLGKRETWRGVTRLDSIRPFSSSFRIGICYIGLSNRQLSAVQLIAFLHLHDYYPRATVSADTLFRTVTTSNPGSNRPPSVQVWS